MPRSHATADLRPNRTDRATSLRAPEREDISFLSGGERCDGWLYRPADPGPHPCVVMGHGFGAIRAAGLPAFPERFARAGITALVFDYRHLGTSQGQPRGLIDIDKQREDYRSAIAHARRSERIDAERIALWGTSFSGGHVLTVAAEDPTVAAGVTMNPFVDGPPTILATIRACGLANAAALGGKWIKDELRRIRRRRPHLVELVGPPGSVAVFTTPDALPGYRSILPDDPTGWEPAIPARILLRIATDRPIRRAKDITCPLLVCVNEQDLITPAGPALRAARLAPRGSSRIYPIGHFDCYAGDWFETVIGDQIDFLREALDATEEADPRD